LLRKNHDIILAVLEAFVYDPVLNWRLAEGSLRLEDKVLDPRKNLSYSAGARKSAPAMEKVGEREVGGISRIDGEAINRVKAKLCGM
jgi:phosphatidylinositol kinase/protein kinase (PI-3  family)